MKSLNPAPDKCTHTRASRLVKAISSLRSRLILLVLLAVVPAFGLELYTNVESRQREIEEVQENALRLTRLASTSQGQLIAGTHQLLILLAQLPQVDDRNWAECNALVSNLRQEYPAYANLGVVDSNGNLVCSAVPFQKPINVADKSWFQRAIASRKFSFGDYQVSQINGKPLLVLSYPNIDPEGKIKSVVFAALDLRWLSNLGKTAQLPSGSSFTVIDSNGRILVRYPNPETWIGAVAPETPVIKAILTQKKEATAETTGLDGVKRLYTFVPLNGTTNSSNLYVSVGIPKTVAFAEANRILALNLSGLGVVAILGLAAAGMGSNLFILRPVKALLLATQQLAEGNVSVRTGLPHTSGELNQLAYAFDMMAETLEQSHRRRNWAEATLRAKEQRYRMVLNNLKEVVFQTDESGLWTFLNPAWVEITGFAIAESIGISCLNYIHPEDQQRHLEQFSLLMERQKQYCRYEVRYLTKEGSYRWMEVHTQLTLAADDMIIGTSGTLTDITDRKQAEREIRLLQTLTTAITDAEDFEAALAVTLAQVCEATGWNFGEAWIPNVDVNIVELSQAWYGSSPELKQFRQASQTYIFAINTGLPGRVFFSQQPEWIQDVSTQSDKDFPRANIALASGLKAGFGVPILANHQVLAVLVFFMFVPRTEDKRLVDLVSAVATQLGSVMQRKQAEEERDHLLEELQREREDLAALSRVTANAVSTLNLEELLKVLLQRIVEVTHADTAVILLKEDEHLYVRATIGIGEELRCKFAVPMGEGFAGTIAATMQPLYLEDAQTNPLIVSSAIKQRGIRTMLGVPLKRHGNLVGVIHVDWCSVRPHSEREIHLLEITAERCTMAILNAQLYEKTKQLQEHLHLQFERMPIGCILQDQDFRCTDWNPAAEKIFGFKKEEVLGKYLPDLIVSSATAYYVDSIMQRLRAGDMMAHSVNDNINKYNQTIICEWYNTPLKQADGTIIGFSSMVQDVTAKQRAEEELRESERRYHTLAKVAPVGIFRINAARHCLYVNERWCELTGIELQQALGDGWIQTLYPDDRERVSTQWYQAIKQNSCFQSEHRLQRPDGNIVWVFCQVSAEIGEYGEVVGYVGTITDITARILAEEQLRQRTFYDSLTGLPNRVLFTEKLRYLIEESKTADKRLFAILLLDLDRFQMVKYSLGHRVAEQLLIATSSKLAGCLRPNDTLARLGADEFAILLSDIQEIHEATRLANCIHHELTSPFDLDGCEVFSSTSIGIAPSTLDYERPEDFLQAADTALHQAKRLGKARNVVFHPTMHAGALERLHLETDLLRAIERHQLQVYYQPIVSIVTGKISGFEALVRWFHPTRGMISPAEFIPLAEETGLIAWIDRWVLREACHHLGIWQEKFSAPSSLTMSVNLSGLQLSQIGLIERIDKILQETGVSGSNLKLEITESMMMENTALEAKMLEQLKALGIKLSIDDFGTGYSSLARLHQLPIDTLKIDRSFVNRIGADSESLEIVRTIITLAHRLDMDVIAEGVETAQQLLKLESLQCEYGQGYFFSTPVDSETALKLVKNYC